MSYRVGLGTASLGGSQVDGTISIQQSATTFDLGSGIPFEAERIVTQKSKSMSITTKDLAAGPNIAPGPAVEHAVSFAFNGNGDAFSAAITGFVDSVNYDFSPDGPATCTVKYDAKGGA